MSRSIVSGARVPIGRWIFECFAYDAVEQSASYYLNTTQYSYSAANFLKTAEDGTANVVVGAGYAGGGVGAYDNMYAANIQMYNISLSPVSINALYAEGIGGVPVDAQHIIAWWPLNGNANDYSGNNNNGQAVNVIFSNQWQNGYTGR